MGSLCVPQTWKRKHNVPAHNKPRTKSAATLSEHWQEAELSSAGICVFVLGLSGQWKMGALLSHRPTTAAVMLLRCGMRSWRWHDLTRWPLPLFIFRNNIEIQHLLRNLQNKDILLAEADAPGWKTVSKGFICYIWLLAKRLKAVCAHVDSNRTSKFL